MAKHRKADWKDVSEEVGKAVKDARAKGHTVDKGKAVEQVKQEYRDSTGTDAT